VSEYRGTRLAVGELPRATTQAAITVALAMGHSNPEVKAPTFREKGARSIFGVMRTLLLDLRIMLLDKDAGGVGEAKTRYDNWRSSRDGQDHLAMVCGIKQTKLDAIVVPVDGAEVLRDGRSGALSIIAAGRPPSDAEADDGCFRLRCGRGFDSFFIVLVGPDALTSAMMKRLEPFEDGLRREKEGSEWSEFFSETPLLSEIVQALRESQFASVGFAISGESFQGWKLSPINGEPLCMRRILDGSAVSAALAALRGKVPASACVARRAQAFQIAVAVRALGGRMYAMPLREERQSGIMRATAHGERWLRASDFANDTNGVLVCTSITEICVLDRVRFGGEWHVTTDTLVASIATRSSREIRQHLDLTRTTFWDEDGKETDAILLLKEFEGRVGQLL
jgi:hypothetical protein